MRSARIPYWLKLQVLAACALCEHDIFHANLVASRPPCKSHECGCSEVRMFASCAGRSVGLPLFAHLCVLGCEPVCCTTLLSGFALHLPICLGLGTTLMREYSFRPLFEAALPSAFSTAASCYESSSPEPPPVPFHTHCSSRRMTGGERFWLQILHVTCSNANVALSHAS